jgi:hypothetical protein
MNKEDIGFLILISINKFKFFLLYLDLIRNCLKNGLVFSILELYVLISNSFYKI